LKGRTLRRQILLAALVTILALSVSILAAPPTVVATHAVFGELAQIVGGDAIDVVTIIPSGFCPSHYDLAPSDYAALLDADLVLYSGIEPWVEQLAGTTKEGALALLSGVWNTPDAAASQAEAIAALLAERYPESASLFEANLATYTARLEATAASLQSEAQAAGTAGIPVVCMQWQVGFVSWLGFDPVVTYGLPEDLSMRDLIDLAEQGRSAGAVLVIDNLQSGIEFGAKLAQEIGAVHVVLSNFPGAMPKTATLLDLLVRNAEALFTAIEPVGGDS
jgi:ABC-type Zn uptake system ZnuABC Zn-binding protein ZnuA